MSRGVAAPACRNLRVVIVDDEPLARRGLRIRLERMTGIEVVEECRNGREALSRIPDLAPDLLLLDVEMPGLSGFDVVRRLQGDSLPAIIFITAFDRYAIEAFDVHAVDYVLKPIDDQRLQLALERARERLPDRNVGEASELAQGTEAAPETARWPELLSIRDGHRVRRLQVAQVDWIEAAGDYLCIHEAHRVHILRCTMKAMERRLDPSLFQRIHRSTIVNLSRIVEVENHESGDYRITLQQGTQLRMSRSYKRKLALITG